MSQEIIDTYVPPTSRERLTEKKNMVNEYEQLKLDVAVLKEEMKLMKQKLGMTYDERDSKILSDIEEEKKNSNALIEEKQ